ncbi:hypothetical protein SK128_025684 [Halocaridina rubra]
MYDCAENDVDKIQSLLEVAEALWSEPKLASQKDEAMQNVKQAITFIAETKTKVKTSSQLQEIEALAYFWLYLCHLQQIQDTATEEVKVKEKSTSLTLQATDLGEEVQADDACDVRPNLTCLTLYAQEMSLASLHVALSLWEDLEAKGAILQNPTLCFTSLASTGYVYQLSGLVDPTVRSWVTLVSLAQRHSDDVYFMRGVAELLFIIPELMPYDLVKKAKERAISSNEDKSQESCFMYMSLYLSAAISYYHLKKGEYESGFNYLKEALSHELMDKRTVRATEVQAIINYVASLYSWLPLSVVKPDQRPSQHAIDLANLAYRQAMAVLKSSMSTSSEILCWRHRVGWLHITTALWLSHLCYATTQPRLARTYLKQSLSLTQELALPLRTGEVLESLAWIDLLCDRIEDCMVKVDSLIGLLVTHPSNPDLYSVSEMPESTAKPPVASKYGNASPTFRIYCNAESNEEESLRTSSSFEFDLKSPDINSGLVVIGAPERINQLSTMQAPPSPSLGFREKLTMVHTEHCPEGFTKCIVCSTPTVHQLRMFAAVLLTFVHAHKGHPSAAQKSLDKFRDMHATVCEKAPSTCSHLTSCMKKKWKMDSVHSTRFVYSKLNSVHLLSLHCQSKILILECEFEEALQKSIEAFKIIQSIDTQILAQDIAFVTYMLTEMNKLKTACDQIRSKRESVDEEPVEIVEVEGEDAVPVIPFKTPAKFFKSTEKSARTRMSSRKPRITYAPMKAKFTKACSYDVNSDDPSELPERFLKVPSSSQYAQKLRLSAKPTPTSSLTSTVPRVYSSEQSDDVQTIGDHIGKVSLDASPCRSILKDPNASPASSRTCSSSSKSSSEGIENICNFDSIEKRHRGARKAQIAVPSVSFMCDEDSPENDVTSTKEVDNNEKEDSKPSRGRPRKTSEEKMKKESKRATSSRGRKTTQTVPNSSSKTRSSRTIR